VKRDGHARWVTWLCDEYDDDEAISGSNFSNNTPPFRIGGRDTPM
jgi:hypothetical protein